MDNFVSYEKLSKKQKKKIAAAKRKNWGDVKPVTRVKNSAKVYNRKKQDFRSYDDSFRSPVLYIGRAASARKCFEMLPSKLQRKIIFDP